MSSHPPASSGLRTPTRLGLSAALVALLGLSGALVATADPQPVFPSQGQVDAAKAAVGSAAAQAASLDAQFAASTARLESVRTAAAAAAEAYNGAVYELDQRTRAAAAARQRADGAQHQAEGATLKVRQYAAAVYTQSGGLGDLEAFVSSSGPQELLDRAASLDAVAKVRNRTLQEASATSAVADTMRRQAAQAQAQQIAAKQRAETARNQAQAQADAAAAEAATVQHQQQQVVAQLATLRHTSVALEGQRQAGLQAAAEARAAAAAAAEQARLAAARAAASRDAAARDAAKRAARAAAAQAAAAATAQSAAAQQQATRPRSKPTTRPSTPRPATPKPPPSTPRPPVPDNPPPPSGGVGSVIAFASAQIGKPYQWGGAGPNTFDCSGLTMKAWQRAGVYLSHFTGAQWAETARVPISDLRPGDLVFYGSSGPTSHHMGLYIGGGQMIEAPYTGANVRTASIYRGDLLPYGGRP